MYELACPACNSSSQYDVSDYLLMCPLCSATFSLERETGHKEVYNDHFIVANSSNPVQVKALVLEWLRRLNHRQDTVDSEFFISDISGLSSPFWVVSIEAHTVWKGLVQRQQRRQIEAKFGADYLIEQGQFKRNYRWAVSGRHNICESWGMTRLHEPKEPVSVGWDGFPLDSTFSAVSCKTRSLKRRLMSLASSSILNSAMASPYWEFRFLRKRLCVGLSFTLSNIIWNWQS